MVRKVVLAATQFACSEDKRANAELFEGLYWCQVQEKEYFSWSAPFEGHPLISRFAQLARELRVVLPVPFFERANNAYFNSVAMVDADGSVLGRGKYLEKFYMSPGDTGFRVFDTAYGKVGIAICWDQWFPEAARALALQGAEVLLFPTAIGSEPGTPPQSSSYPHWIRVQQVVVVGHAGSNLLPLVASNRIGTEQLPGASPTTFYGGSFIAGHQGQILAQVGATSSSPSLELSLPGGNPHPAPAPLEGFVTAEVDLDLIAAERAAWGVFRDRRPELYGPLATLGGSRA
ncbi:hypothetical protein PLESTB_001539300 [Pleodorina starrii]|uniref:CN hydrolase domain-containing protein n=1 Tax=Pleodorina starrii TaxID=330485 RepID=A0A9W6F8L7_9CHLO|nr:hypothetical protein PLESTB_001539300 [Pleodorina starrii]